MIEITGKFDFLVAGSGNFGNGAFQVPSHGGANGVELQANWVDGVLGLRCIRCMGCVWLRKMWGVRGPAGFGGGGPFQINRREACGVGTADKCASVHALHSTSSGRKGNRD